MVRIVRIAAVSALSLSLAACRDAALSLAPSPVQARQAADDLFGALANRFGPIQLDPRLAAVRTKFARSFLVPSRILNDSVMWTDRSGADRSFQIEGTPEGGGAGRFHLFMRAAVPAPSQPAKYRRTIRLKKLGGSDYEWSIRDELAVGTVTKANLAAALTSLLSGLEARSEQNVRAEYAALLPRATAALGRLFDLDSIRLVTEEDGATGVLLSVSLHPERIAYTYPSYARYLRKYISPASYNISVTDLTGARWWEASARQQRLTLRFRVYRGSLAPLSGPPRSMPDSLAVRVDFLAKMLFFHIGVRRLAGDLTLTRAPSTAGYAVRFRKEPDWVLPPLVERFIRSPLRRPFEGDGLVQSLAVRDSADFQTLAVREYTIAVRESPILRWLGGVGNTAVSDFRRGAERESDLYTGEVLHALRLDAMALIQASAGAQ